MTLLVVVDMQKDFITGPLGTPEAERIVPAVAALVKESDRVVYTKDTHREDYLETQEGKHLPVKHCIEGTEGWEILPEVFKEHSLVFQKPTFGSLALASWASKLGFDKIVLCGVCTDICVISNALLLKAELPEAEIAVVADACAGATPEKHRAALEVMRSCQIEIL